MTATPVRAGAPGWAALASIGAGAIHATAAGAHGEHRQTAAAFALLAIAQIGWGVLALLRAHPAISSIGAAVNVAAVAGWVLAKTTGVGAIDGLEAAEGLGFADTAAAVLAGVAAAGAVAALAAPRWRPSFRGTEAVTAVAVSAIVLIAMVATGSHSHAGGHAHDADTIADHDHGEDDGHGHAPGEDASGEDHDHTGTGDDHAEDDHTGTGDDHEGDDHTHPPGTHPPGTHPPGTHPPGTHPPGTHPPGTDPPGTHPPGTHPNLPAKPYDGTLPVDLSGVPGVTAAQQARAEELVTDTIIDLPRFRDSADAEAAGYVSIGDGFTGYEHFVNWSLLSDGRILDAEYPESLVYRVGPGGVRTLEAAMYMLEQGATLDDVPNVLGKLAQFHIHNDLCWVGPTNAWRVSSVVPPSSPCPAGSFRLPTTPMVHVWIVGHPCGPFAALEGVGGGQVGDGEDVLCDHAHGSPAAV
jgi:hypothetical protein